MIDIKLNIRNVRLEQENNRLLAKYVLARSLAWREKLAELEAIGIASLTKALDIVAKDLRKRLAEEADGLAKLPPWRKERDAALLSWVDEVTAGAQATLTGAVDDVALAAATTSLNTYNNILSFDGRAANVRTVGLTPAQIAAWFGTDTLLHTGVANWVKKSFVGGIGDALLTELHRSAIEGKGTAETIRRLLHRALDSGMATTRREMAVLARTYTQTANNMARETVYKANRDLIKGYKWVTALDNHVCMTCAVADGTLYTPDEPRPSLPCHPCCRCLMIAVFKTWRDFGIDGADLHEVTRPWTMRKAGELGTGAAKIENYGTSKENYEGWWRSLSDADKAKCPIGMVRRELLEQGRISWQDMFDKASGRVRTLEQMGFAHGLKGERTILYDKAAHTRLLNKTYNTMPIAIIRNSDREKIGAKTNMALLSFDTWRFHNKKHPEITQENYAKVQDITLNWVSFQQDAHSVAIAQTNEKGGHVIVLKSSADGNAVYLSTLYRLSGKEKKRNKELKRLQRGKLK